MKQANDELQVTHTLAGPEVYRTMRGRLLRIFERDLGAIIQDAVNDLPAEEVDGLVDKIMIEVWRKATQYA